MKKLLSVLFFTILILPNAKAYDFQYNGLYYNITTPSGSSTKTCEVTYGASGSGTSSDKSDYTVSDVVVPEGVAYNGYRYLVTAVGDYAFANCSSIKSLIVNSSTTRIGKCAFYDCNNLETVQLNESVKTIDKNAFSNDSLITSFTMPGVETLGYCSLGFLKKLKTLEIPASAKDIDDEALIGLMSLESITVDPDNPYFMSENGIMYSKDKKIMRVFPGGRTGEFTVPEGVQEINIGCFWGSNLSKITIANSVKKIGGSAFRYSLKLESIDLGFGVEDMSGCYTFWACPSLKQLVIPNSVKNIGPYLVAYCTNLEEIVFGESVEKFGSSSFYNSSTFISLYASSDGIAANTCLKNIVLLSKKIPENYYYTSSSKYYSIFPRTPYGRRELSWQSSTVSTFSYMPSSYTPSKDYWYESDDDYTGMFCKGDTLFAFYGNYKASKPSDMSNYATLSDYKYNPDVEFYYHNGYVAFDFSKTGVDPQQFVGKKIPATELIGKTIDNIDDCGMPAYTLYTSPDIEDAEDGETYNINTYRVINFASPSDDGNGYPYYLFKPIMGERCKVTGVYDSGKDGLYDSNTDFTLKLRNASGLTDGITYTLEGVYRKINDDAVLEVLGAASITLSTNEATINVGGTLSLSATVLPNEVDNHEIQWSSSDSSIASVSSTGVVTGIALGTATITATTTDGTNLSACCEVTVDNLNSIYLGDLRTLENLTPMMPVYLDNYIEICNAQFDVVLPEGVNIYYDENDDEEEVYWVTKGERAKEAHTVAVSKNSANTYRVVISSTSNAIFKDADKTLPIAYIKLDIDESLEAGTYNAKIQSAKVSSYTDGVTVLKNVEDSEAEIIIPPSYSVIASSSNAAQGTVNVTGEKYDATTQKTKFGSSVTLTATPSTGYHFVEWTENDETLSTKNPYTFSTIAANHTIKGVFAPNTYTVTFTVDGETYSSGTQNYGDVVVAPEDPVKTGYTFMGWKNLTSTTTVPAKDVTYEAEFSINQYTVKFVADGNTVYEQKQDYNSDIVAPEAPTKDRYAFVTWGDVLDKVPANDVTYTAEYVLLGDLYIDGEINIGDLTALVGIILDDTETIEPSVFKSADIYTDNKINVVDYTSLVGLILHDQSSGAKARGINANIGDVAMMMDDFRMTSTQDGSFGVYLQNPNKNIAALQFDLELPNGLSFTEDNILVQSASLKQSVSYKILNSGALRVMVYSANNSAIRENKLMDINLSSITDDNYNIVMKNIVCATANNDMKELDDIEYQLSIGATAIKNAKENDKLIVTVENEALVIRSNLDTLVNVVNLTGDKIADKMLCSGNEMRLALPKGVYIVNGVKYILK